MEEQGQEKIVNMNWVHVTQRLAREFSLPGSFVLARNQEEWVGMQPPKAFRNYLKSLFQSKEASYFDEIRFYKYNEDAARPGDEATVKYLALIPVKIKGVPYDFLGLLYESPDKLQELLRMRIMPNYTLFWLYQLVAEARVRNANQGGQKTLLKALAEQRMYAKRLETQVANLHQEINHVKSTEMSLDQKVEEMSRLLDRQMLEYDRLAENYQQIFGEHQALQEDFLGTCVRMETRINELESKILTMDPDALLSLDATPPSPMDQDIKDKSTRRISAIMERLQTSNQNLINLQEEYEALKASYGGITPQQVQQMLATMEDMRGRLDYYKKSCDEKDARIRRIKSRLVETVTKAGERGSTPGQDTSE